MKVRLHSNDEAAVEATDRTLCSIPGSVIMLRRNPATMKVEFDENGLAEIVTSNPGFAAFAMRNQGYVAEVIES